MGLAFHGFTEAFVGEGRVQLGVDRVRDVSIADIHGKREERREIN